MKMKKGLLMVVLLLALSSIMAAMSYTSATVTSAMTGTVVSTDKALLALSENKHHNASKIDDGMLKIDFNKGHDNKNFGLQRQSEYIWENLFYVTNNSENKVDVTISTENQITSNVKLYVMKNGSWEQIDFNKGVTFESLNNSTQNKGNQMGIDLKVVVDKNASYNYNNQFKPNLVVSGNAVKSVKP